MLRNVLCVAAAAAAWMLAGVLLPTASTWRRGAWGVLGAYLVTFFDGAGKTAKGREWPAFKRLAVWKYVVKLVAPKFLRASDGGIKQYGQYVFSIHPHGVISASHFALMTDGAGFLSKVHSGPRRDIVADILMVIPGVRELLLWLGNVRASQSVFSGALSRGFSVMLYAGGEQEQMRSQVGEHTVYIRRRKGFLRLALQHGVPVVPIYVFGETDLYRTFGFAKGLRMWLVRTLRVAIPLFWGRFPWPAWRKGVTLTYALGDPIPPPPRPAELRGKLVARDDPLIDTFHKAYMAGLQATFDGLKERAGYADAQLVMV